MSKTNLLIHLNAYEDQNATNNPVRNNFKWTRDAIGIDIEQPTSRSISLQPGEIHRLFEGLSDLSSDTTTTWDLSLKSGSTSTYVLKSSSGTAPEFREARSTGADATTEVTVTKNASLLTFSSTGGQVFDLVSGGVAIGDIVRIGSEFSSINQGKYKILSFSATSFTVESELGVAEGPIVLGADFVNQVKIHSDSGVRIGSKIDLVSGFSSVSFGTYDITDVADDFVEFFSNKELPEETSVSNDPAAILIYENPKKLLYIESDQELSIRIDGGTITNKILPMAAGKDRQPGVFLSSSLIKSAEIENTSKRLAKIFYVTAE